MDFRQRTSYHFSREREFGAAGCRSASRVDAELRGYLFWGPVALAIACTECCFGVGWVQKKLDVTIPWPTISTTVGHLQERWNVVAALVVGIIAATAFTAVAYRSPDEKTANGRTMPKRKPELTKTPFYSWQLGIFPAVLAGAIAAMLTDRKLVIGYAIYGAFVVYGVVVPTLLVRLGRKKSISDALLHLRQAPRSGIRG